ncbi:MULTISPECIES: GyrI-like domain-containing protein [Pseudofrankia]|uniref:GyrI-like domain-containing protein n=1 Tax=Pseudofrankia TaxID=2994363 RepID=UPI0018E3B9C8|nr:MULTISPECIES: GyrI-like domain-containing protein [Pseudofrankia]
MLGFTSWAGWLRDGDGMSYQVTVEEVRARPTAVVAATTTWAEFPALWGTLLDDVWTSVRAAGVAAGCRTVMLYLDDVPNVQVGVTLREPCPLTGHVVASALPAGVVARTVHRGPYTALAGAHQAVVDRCAAAGLHLAGPRWEIYGDHRDDPADLETEIYWLLSAPVDSGAVSAAAAMSNRSVT